MKIVIISKNDRRGGAAVVSLRLMQALQSFGEEVHMLVAEKETDIPGVELAATPKLIKRKFLEERFRIFLANGFNRKTLFQIDTGETGLPLWRHPLVKAADAILLNWINQGMLSLKGIEKILQLGKPVIWTMHDLWPMTGICHHPHDCRHFMKECGNCPLLGKKAAPDDLSRRVWQKKKRLYSSKYTTNLRFVAVSEWLKGKALVSSLLKDRDITVIHNAVNTGSDPYRCLGKDYSKIRILFGAARLDDLIKGFPDLIRATQILSSTCPGPAKRLELITFGTIRDPQLFEQIAISHKHLGEIKDDRDLNALYGRGHLLVSASEWETLGMTLAEAQFHGVFPIAFDHGGQRDIINAPFAGLLLDWDEDAEKRAERIAEGIKRGIEIIENDKKDLPYKLYSSAKERFSPENIAREYLQLITQQLKN